MTWRLIPEPQDRRTAVAMTRLFFEYSQISLVAGLVMIAVRTGWVLHDEPSPWLVPWLTYCLALLGLRWHWRRRCLALAERELSAQASRWQRRAEASSVGVALMWMWALAADFRAGDAHAQMFCTMIACITCVGSINVMAPLPRAYWALAAPTLALLALQFSLLATWSGAAAAVLVVVGFALSSSIVHRHARLLFHSHALRFEREDLIAQVEQTSQARSRFLAAASHDLRQPLHALGLLTDQLQAEIGQHPAAGTAEQIERMVHALDSLVDGLLDVSRLDAGAVKVAPVDMPLGPLLEQLSASFLLTAQARRLQWRLRPSTAWVRSDPLQLERILRNIVDNALRCTVNGGVLLGCRRRGNQLLVGVWDTGPGIAAADQPRVFEEFVQLGNAGRDRRQGLGLGLAIVARLCRLLDHPLQLRSRIGRGSCFAILLPVVPAGAPRAMQPGLAPEPAVPAFASPLEGLEVALIEDDDAVRESTTQLLRRWGCRVHAGADVDGMLGQLDAGASWQPAAIISDQRLAAGNGIDAIARLRHHCGRQVPALLLSGESLALAADALAAEHITPARKPLPAHSLRAWLSAQPPPPGG